MNTQKPYERLSSSSLKMIAMISMFIDHFGYTIVYWSSFVNPLSNGPWYQICRGIGRIAFPIYCYLLVEGFLHTSSRIRYATRIFLFGILCEFPFDMVFSNCPMGHIEFTYQNVMFTLFIGLITIWGMEYCANHFHPVLQIIPAMLGLGAAYISRPDYGWKGILLIMVLYFFRYYKVAQTIIGCVCLYWEWIACFAFIPIRLYNHKKGWMTGAVGKYATYLFYPIHLFLLALLRHLLFTTQFPFL